MTICISILAVMTCAAENGWTAVLRVSGRFVLEPGTTEQNWSTP